MGKLDVFVCFNGENMMTRDQSFGQGLFDALKEAHISAVVDEKPKQGKFLRKAMKKKTTIFVVVFSRQFASCSVRMNELVQIVKERKDGQIIVPVFYEVDPSDVRKQRGDYQIKSDGVEAIQALKTVSSIKGLESRQFESDEELIKVIVEDVRQKLAAIKIMKWIRRGIAVGVAAGAVLCL